MEHYITAIQIHHVRHLRDINLSLDAGERKHLILTGKNGSGKTSLLEAIKRSLSTINQGDWSKKPLDYQQMLRGNFEHKRNSLFKETGEYLFEQSGSLRENDESSDESEIRLSFNEDKDLDQYFAQGAFLTAYFPAGRLAQVDVSHGVEEVRLQRAYSMDQDPVRDLIKYMVHLKTQQAYAQNENNSDLNRKIENWMELFENAIRRLMDDDSIKLVYDYRNYNFLIHQKNRDPYDFCQLSDGYSAAIRIVADLLLRMDQNWLIDDTEISLNMEGIVLVDEIETHLHLELQKSILPFLTELFPRIQFIVSTHSPFVVNSLDNVMIFDLENLTSVNNGLTNVSYSGIVESYFKVDEISKMLAYKFARYKALIQQETRTDDEWEELVDLEMYLNEIPDYLSPEVASEYKRLKLEFELREDAK